jgi:hypothetical protein
MEEINKEELIIEKEFNKEDAKLLRDNRFVILASILFIVMVMVAVLMIYKRLDHREEIILRKFSEPTPTPITIEDNE